jgi:hypothetical protein
MPYCWQSILSHIMALGPAVLWMIVIHTFRLHVMVQSVRSSFPSVRYLNWFTYAFSFCIHCNISVHHFYYCNYIYFVYFLFKYVMALWCSCSITVAPDHGYKTCQIINRHFLKSVPCWFYHLIILVYTVAMCSWIITSSLHEVAQILYCIIS